MTTGHPPIDVIRGDLVKVLFFDVFGTCVQQRTPVADELSKAAKEALNEGGIDDGVRKKAEGMVWKFQLCAKVVKMAVVDIWCRHTMTGSNSEV